MIVFPNAKINLGLNILSKRADGFHEIESVFYPVYKCYDALEIIEDETVEFEMNCTNIELKPNDNLCKKAYDLIKNDYKIKGIKAHLLKKIPVGAGLGGGSADAAFMLKLLNDKFNLNIPNEKLKLYAAKLGSDCAFFIDNRPALSKGRGEVLQKIALDLSKYYIYLVYPNIHISTAEAYRNVTPKVPNKTVGEIIQLPVEKWKDYLVNDFEYSLFHTYPVLATIKEKLYDLGAVYASMSGSGSTIYGIFKNPVKLTESFKDMQVI